MTLQNSNREKFHSKNGLKVKRKKKKVFHKSSTNLLEKIRTWRSLGLSGYLDDAK